MTRIEGKVASILTERELVLNVGATHGVEVGMRFDILYAGGIKVRNPDNPREILGSVEWPKTQVKVVQIYETMCVARTFRTVTIPARGSAASSFRALSLGIAETYVPQQRKIETLRTDETRAARELSEEESLVKVGDVAVQVVPVAVVEDAEEESGESD